MEQKVFEISLGGKILKIRHDTLAEQANGSVFVELGGTVVLATCVMAEKERDGADFFPLTVEYEEKYYAAGKIRGTRFIKREGRPSDEAISTARLIDRTIRPLFPEGLRRDVQVIVTVLSWDGENDADILGVIAASCSLAISNIPWNGPVGAVRIGTKALGAPSWIINPTYEDRKETLADIVFAGPEHQQKILINMIEAECAELPEKEVVGAAQEALSHIQALIDLQKQIVAEVGKQKLVVSPEELPSEVIQRTKEFLGSQLEDILFKKIWPTPKAQMETVNNLKDELITHIQETTQDPSHVRVAKNQFEQILEDLIVRYAVQNKQRVDGRGLDELRPLSSLVGILPRTHGSGLFIRGTTKALSIVTLGSPGDQQLLEGMELTGKKRFMHHYNFPPYCSGEIAPMRGPGRREIGHGMLAERALEPMIPDYENFPYTIRTVTEILSSNGSTSMASACAASLALMDAGVPMKRPVAGISIGIMVAHDGSYELLTDIQGPEDHHGYMDFKIAGTKQGITAMQMDVKIHGITGEMLERTLEAGQKARMKILDHMAQTLEEPRPSLSPYAPRIVTLQINPQRIRDVIGPGGKIINEIIAETGVTIDIEDSGRIFIASPSEQGLEKAVEWIKNLTHEFKIGEVFVGRVKRILDFGAFVEILPGQEGLIHISQLAPYRVGKVEDIVKIGDTIPVKIISVDEQGRINLSLKEAGGAGTKPFPRLRRGLRQRK